MMYLDENTLGQLDFTCVDGIITTEFEIGWPEVREVTDPRALSDGSVDTTRFLGSRAVTVSIRYNQKVLPTQNLVDMVTPYLSPRVRPTITWSIQDPPAGPNYMRSLSVPIQVPHDGSAVGVARLIHIRPYRVLRSSHAYWH